MGFLSKLAGGRPAVNRMPSGSFTVDLHGRVVSSTVPRFVPDAQVREIGRQILLVFQGARSANLGFSELILQYAGLKITAREMRGGAIIFLTPRTAPSLAEN
jgi:hypothetical protein